MPVPAHIVAYALVGSDEIRRFGVDGQQSALGSGNPEADIGEWHAQGDDSGERFMVVPGSVAGAR